MSYKNSRKSYGTIAKALHWAMAAMFLVSYLSIYFRQYLTVRDESIPWQGTANYTAFQLHVAVGITIFVFAILRIIWRLYDTPPHQPAANKWEMVAARTAHFLLYGVMIVMPITGYIGTDADVDYFGITRFRNTQLYDWLVTSKLGLTFEEFEAPVDYIHKNLGGAIVVWLLVVVHAVAALYHHLVRKDNVLKSMLPGRVMQGG